MPNVERIVKLEKAHTLLLQFPHGIRAEDFARKFGLKIRNKPYHKTTAYDILNALDFQDWAYNDHGLWFPKDKKTSVESNKILSPVKSWLGPFGWLDRRAESKRREKLELQARIDAWWDAWESSPDGYTEKELIEKVHEHRKRYNLE